MGLHNLLASTLAVATLGTTALGEGPINTISYADISTVFNMESVNTFLMGMDYDMEVDTMYGVSMITVSLDKITLMPIEYNGVSFDECSCGFVYNIQPHVESVVSGAGTTVNISMSMPAVFNAYSSFMYVSTENVPMSIYYSAGVPFTTEIKTATLNVATVGKSTFSTGRKREVVPTWPVEIVTTLDIVMEGILTYLSEISFSRYAWAFCPAELTMEANLTYTKRCRDVIKIEPWVIYRTNGASGRIHIPTDPCM